MDIVKPARATLAGVVAIVAFSSCSAFDAPEFAPEEWQRLSTLTSWNDADPPILRGIGAPPRDRSNGLLGVASATFPREGYPVAVDGTLAPGAALGKQFFFDPRFSGVSTGADLLGRVDNAHARVAVGQPTGLACVSCHDLGRAASDPLAAPISIGAGSIGANAPALSNVGFFPLLHWNGRFDSLWAQALVVTEVGVVQNESRLEVAWNLWRYYRDQYQAVFGAPVFGEDPAVIAALDASIVAIGPGAGQCSTPTPGVCAAGCLPIAGACWPRFPRAGAPSAQTVCLDPGTTPWACMTPADQASVTTAFVNFGKAIAAFEQTLAAGDAPFDLFMHEGKDSNSINAAAKRGARLFVTKGSCFNCHNTPLFSNRFFYNVAVATTGPLELTTADCPAGSVACDCATPARADSSCLPWGALTGLELLRAFPLRRNSAASDDPTDPTVIDFLKERLTEYFGAVTDDSGLSTPIPRPLKWQWKTASLRNVAVTAPYMHNGRYATLAEVVHHYNRGGDPQAPGAHPVLIKPLGLTDDEEADLVEFLKTLTSPPWPDPISAAPELPGALP